MSQEINVKYCRSPYKCIESMGHLIHVRNQGVSDMTHHDALILNNLVFKPMY